MVRSQISTLSLLAVLTAESCSAFAPAGTKPLLKPLSASAIAIEEPARIESAPLHAEDTVPIPPASPERIPAPRPKKTGPQHKDGPFSPVVQLFKLILGEKKLNKVRAQVISMHSDVIGSFVETSDSAFGQAVLQRLFELSDVNHDGTVDKEELQAAFSAIGFSWLQAKQVDGILKRADTDGNGLIDLEEWISAAPKTLRTNLIKLAKKNGGELGFLV